MMRMGESIPVLVGDGVSESEIAFGFLIIPISPIVLQIGFEKKYAENSNEYLHTLLGTGITIVIMGTLLFILSPGF